MEERLTHPEPVMRREVRITPKVFGPMGSAHFLPSLLNFAAPVDVADNAACVWRRCP